MNELFHHVAVKISAKVGSSSAFIVAVLLVIGWATGGMLMGFTDTWLLIINTTCSVTTFLIVFLIQNSQNRQSRTMQLKLDELLKGVRSARTELIDLEEVTDQELDEIQADFHRLRETMRNKHAAKASITKTTLKIDK